MLLRRLPLRLLQRSNYSSSSTRAPTSPHPTTSTSTPEPDAASRGDGVTAAPPLPPPDDTSAGAGAGAALPSLHVGGDALKLGALGPLVVNVDGSVGRVANWNEMTAAERDATLRLLKGRNRDRLAALRAR